MTVFIALTICYTVAAGIGVLWVNPRRSANQAFANLSVLCAIWCSCVMMSFRDDNLHHNRAAGNWLLANTIVAAFLPWANWLVKESLAVAASTKELLLRSAGWFVFGIGLSALCFAPSFVIPPPTPGARHQHGGPYFLYVALEVLAHLLIVLQAYRQMRRQVGIRRLEIQCLILNLGVAYFVCALLNGVGSYLHLAWLKSLTFPIGFGAFGITGWAITVHRVFDARQVLLSIAHFCAVVAFAGLLIVVVDHRLRGTIPAPFGLLLSAAFGTVITLWLHKASRQWLGLDGRNDLQRIRTEVIEISKTEIGTDELVAAFETLLQRECQTEKASVLSPAIGRHPPFALSPGDPACVAICDLGWATPESLHRLRSNPRHAALEDLLQTHSLALLLVVPRGSPNPSLLLGLGPKLNRGPFTFPEVERLISVAELMDNILARARLTTQAALQAKTDHLAMMSRGLAHDLKNLITPISSFLVHTDRKFPPASDEAEVHDAAKRSVRIITDYISEALFFANRLTPRYERVAIASMLETVREVTSRRAAQRNVLVVFDAPPDLSLVADTVLLQRMLGNLVANAIDASVREARVRVEMAARPNGSVRIQVTDQGCGIPDANLKRVFDPYFTTKEFGDDIRGFGLGLTICQKIVALHHGTISLESRSGCGTTVTVELPSAPPVSARSPDLPQEPAVM